MKMKNTLRCFCLVLCGLCSVLVGSAQNFSGHGWYFGGSNQGIRFSRSNNQPSLVTQTPLGSGGSAVVNDPVNGNLLFYTDGSGVYDVAHNLMPNGGGLNGNTNGNQPVVVAKVPGQATQYYIITNSADFTTGGNISLTVVDMSLFGNAVFPTPALGDVATKNVPIAGLTGRSEAMIVVPHSNGTDFWLITHVNGSPDYSVTLFNSTGPSTTNLITGLGFIEVAANFSYHPSTGRLAVSPQEPARDVEILSFDNTNGFLSSQQIVFNSGRNFTGNEGIYDTEWSASGDFLYLSVTGEAGINADVLQFNLQAPLTTLTSVLDVPIFRSYGLQTAPDSTIYHLYQAVSGGPFLVGSISNSDTVATEVNYTPSLFNGRNFAGTQFPSFTPFMNQIIAVSFISDGQCANTPTAFFPTVSPAADSLVWNFGDGSGSREWSPVYTYQAGGSYNVSVTAFLNGQSQTTSQPVAIIDFDTQITLVQDTTACSCELPFPGVTPPPPSCGQFSVTAQLQGSGAPTLQWYGPGGAIPGATTATLQPDSAGYYYLVATVGGCAAYAGVNIKEYDVEDQRANIWFFGQNAGIDFNPLPDNPPAPIQNGVMDAPEGTATISDRNGQVIFFTDGDRVWDRNETEIASGIGGDPLSAQSSLIIPVPGDETLYYIFTTQQVHGTYTYELRYSLFDLKLNGGTGGLVEQNVLLFSKSTERITGNENWLIAHEYGNNSFRAYRISNLGIGNPVISSIGSDHNITSEKNGQGYMKLGSTGRLAVALSTPGVSNVVEIFDFDTTGVVSNFRTADLGSPSGEVYGVEFSSGGNKLFATLRNGTSQLYEFAIDSLGRPYQKKPPVAPVAGQLGAIQIGPDGQMYVAVDGQTSLGVILVNEDTTQVSQFNPAGFGLLPGTTSRLGLPNFIQTIADPIQGPGIGIAGVCFGDTTSFSGSGTDVIDQFFWQITSASGGAVITTSTQQEFQFLFTAPGDYSASLRITNRCGLDTTLTRDFTVVAAPPDPSGAFALCTGERVLDANPAGLTGLSFVWSTGDSTQTITVNQQAIYSVTVTNAAGCTTDGQILVADNRPVLNFGPNQTLCQNTPVFPMDAGNPGATYAWTINGVASSNTRRQSVDTSLPGVFEYEVTVTDPITTCFVRDSVVYTFNESPSFTETPTNATCGLTNGSINLVINGPANTFFTYSITGPSTTISNRDQVLGQAGPNPTVSNLGAGTYGITLADQVTGCQTIRAVTINNPNITVTPSQNNNCDPNINIRVVVAEFAPGTTISFRVFNQGSLTPVDQGTGIALDANRAFFTNAVPSGASYIVEVTETATGCLASSNPISITQDPPLTITFDESLICSNNILTAISAGATAFDWTQSPPGSVSPLNAPSVTVAPGIWNVIVTASGGGPGTCPGVDSLTVVVDPPIAPDFTQSDACSDQVTLTATPAGNFLYRWFRNGILDNNLGGTTVFVGPPDDGQAYRVIVFNPGNGCSYGTGDKTIQVDGELTVTTSSTPACENTPFTITSVPNRSVSAFAWSFNNTAIAGQTSSTLQDQRAGTYRVTVTESNCTAFSDITINPAPSDPGNLSPIARICPDPANPDPETREAELIPGDFVSYNWFKDGIALGITTSSLVVVDAGIYSVDLVNSFGCTSEDKTEVLVDCNPVIVGPNAFRPTSTVIQDGELVNQTFRLFTFFIDDENFEIFIFNRWGEIVFKSIERDFRWNGGYNNNASEILPSGTYTYLVRYKSSYRPDEDIQEQRGGVVLLR